MTRRLPFQQLLHRGVGEGATPFPGLLHFTLDPYLIMLRVKQGGIKYYFLSLWYDSTWDWTSASRTIGSTHWPMAYIYLNEYIYILNLKEIRYVFKINFRIKSVLKQPHTEIECLKLSQIFVSFNIYKIWFR